MERIDWIKLDSKNWPAGTVLAINNEYGLRSAIIGTVGRSDGEWYCTGEIVGGHKVTHFQNMELPYIVAPSKGMCFRESRHLYDILEEGDVIFYDDWKRKKDDLEKGFYIVGQIKYRRAELHHGNGVPAGTIHCNNLYLCK